MPNEITAVFHNGSNYDYNFIVKELANEFERQFECIEENTKKYKTVSVAMEKQVTNIDKEGNESILQNIIYIYIYIYNVRYMETSLLNFVDNLTEIIHKIKCKDYGCFAIIL